MTTFVGNPCSACAFGDVEDDAVACAEELVALGRDVSRGVEDCEGFPEFQGESVYIQTFAGKERFRA